MGAGYTRQSAAEIAPGELVTAAGLEAEFDAIEAAMNGSTGHTHDGTTGEGPQIDLEVSVTGQLPVANGGIGGIHKLNATTAPTVNDDTGDGYAVGSMWIDTTNDLFYLCLDASSGAAVWRRYQPNDAELTALAGLTSAADKLPYFTGSGTAALADFTAFGRTVVASADEAAFQTNVGLEIGVDVQEWSANLDEYDTVNPTAAGLALLDDATASDQLTTLGVSAFAKTLLDDADAATAVATLEIDPQAEADWEAGVANTESVVSPAKIAAAIVALAPASASATTGSEGVVQLSTEAETVAGTASDRAVTPLSLASAMIVPVGSLMAYAGASAPNHWLLCYGQAISRTTYSKLFTAISTTYGAGDGSTTFNLPDLRGRVVAGQDDMGGVSADRLTDQSGGVNGDTLGDTGGAETHTLTTAQLASHTHTQQGTFTSGSESADHTHTQAGTFSTSASGTHTHGYSDNSYGIDGDNQQFTGAGTSGIYSDSKTTDAGGNHTHTVTISGQTSGRSAAHSHQTTISGATTSAGSGSAHNNVQPTIILNYIIYTGV